MEYIVSIIIILAFIVFELRLFNLKRNSRDYFGLDKDNDYRCRLNDEDIMNNIYHINKLSKGIVLKLTGWRCSVVLKLITAILILCVINLISINIF